MLQLNWPCLTKEIIVLSKHTPLTWLELSAVSLSSAYSVGSIPEALHGHALRTYASALCSSPLSLPPTLPSHCVTLAGLEFPVKARVAVNLWSSSCLLSARITCLCHHIWFKKYIVLLMVFIFLFISEMETSVFLGLIFHYWAHEISPPLLSCNSRAYCHAPQTLVTS